MPVRLLKQYNGQQANTVFWGSSADEDRLKGSGLADDMFDQATDYQQFVRIVSSATANTSRYALVYKMSSTTAQTLTLQTSGYWPVGTALTIIQQGTGATTVVPASGVTINNALTSLVTKGQNTVAQLIKTAADTWNAVGSFGG